MVKPKSKGRQKIKIEKIEKESSLHVAFTKRRSSVFRNANDLCTMTGAEVALFVFSPGNKPYSFGNPAVQPLITRYKNGDFEPQASSFLQPQRIFQMEKASNDIAVLKNKVEEEKQMEKSKGNEHNLMEAPLESFTYDELANMKAVLEDLRTGVRVQIGDLKSQNAAQKGSSLNQPNQPGGIGQSVSVDGFQFAPSISNTPNGMGQSISMDGFQFTPAISNTPNGIGQGQSIAVGGFQFAHAISNSTNGGIGQSILVDDYQFAQSAASNTSNGSIGQSISMDGFQFAQAATSNTSNGGIGQSISMDGFQFVQGATSNTSNGGGGFNIPRSSVGFGGFVPPENAYYPGSGPPF